MISLQGGAIGILSLKVATQDETAEHIGHIIQLIFDMAEHCYVSYTQPQVLL
ncbi:hypothetical protein Selin_0236 [Desulfurispirillum indicum S5]|uniref:Uncharacterized protein n=1 Tax=Desulfurispirillum indicum (strain ATCC BAA-1389 / DSM 22839 / S5) TaxID=653733 RepID=E6W654_DESIS|nr:hypothetical protein Selin_0236 [Desulfurispirillum indicum S5]